MILTKFPGPDDLAAFHRENVIVYARSTEVKYSRHTAPLSLKYCLSGEEKYHVDGVPLVVDRAKVLLINDRQPYSSEILSVDPVESFCLFFRDGIDREVFRDLFSSNESLLDDPNAVAASVELRAGFIDRTSLVDSTLRRICSAVLNGEDDQLWLDEQFYDLAYCMLVEQVNRAERSKSLPYAKESTRKEIYRRLSLSRDFIESNYGKPLSIEDLAKVSCLSRFHFLRLFRAAFGVTPHQFVKDVRLRRAAELLSKESRTVTEICMDVGYSNLSSFSKAFKNFSGKSPSEYRLRHRVRQS